MIPKSKIEQGGPGYSCRARTPWDCVTETREHRVTSYTAGINEVYVNRERAPGKALAHKDVMLVKT